MRIVGGELRGRPLMAPPDDRLRPTADRVREALFNILQHRFSHLFRDGVDVLDLFAGTGALGFEALSRGARHCLFVETDPKARALIRRNAERLGVMGRIKLWRRDATNLGRAHRENLARYALLFADPPYGHKLALPALSSALSGGWLTDSALAIVEEREDLELSPPEGFSILESRRYGKSRLWFFQRLSKNDAATPSPETEKE